MRFFSTLASASLLATQALCETPTGYKITVNEHLGIGYNSTNIIPNQHLSMACKTSRLNFTFRELT